MEKELYDIGFDIDNKYYKYYKYEKEGMNIICRGIFDRFGSIDARNKINSELNCYIDIISNNNHIYLDIIDKISNKIKIKYDKNIYNKQINIIISNKNAYDFLKYIYNDSDARYRNDKLYSIYEDWLLFGFNICSIPILNINLTDKNAIKPYKNKASDLGYNLTIIKKIKNINSRTIEYDSFIKIKNNFGFYIKLIPCIELIEKGYMLLNNIDDWNRDETIKVILIKLDNDVPDIQLPFCCCKIMVDKILNYDINLC